MPKTLAALPSSQYATALLLTSGNLDLVAADAFWAAFAVVDNEALDLNNGLNCFEVVFNMGELTPLAVFCENAEAAKRLIDSAVARSWRRKH